MRDLILRGGAYSKAERQAILDYCASDVTASSQLLGSSSNTPAWVRHTAAA